MGIFKKVVIADRLAVFVDIVYNDPSQYEGLTLIIGTVFFAFQIYCDFSGYSDIAIGTARIMGFELMKNFDRPYFSKSISEFWKRWHISLSTWFRDYLYIPLGGNRVIKWRWYYNLFITFVVSGLWHGANWTFLIWGALHGTYLIIGILTSKIHENFYNKIIFTRYTNLKKAINVFITFLLVCFAWIFFRANNLADAFVVIKNSFLISIEKQLYQIIEIAGNKMQLFLSVGLILLLLSLHLIERKRTFSQFLSSQPVMIRWGLYCLFIWMIIYLGVFEENQFIYFQF